MNSLLTTHTVAGLHPKSGGPSQAVVQVTNHLARIPDLSVKLICESLAGEPSIASGEGVERRTLEARSPCMLRLAFGIRSELLSAPNISTPQIIHSHGIWLPANYWAAKVAVVRKIPLIVQPHGMLEPWALNYRRLKKRLALKIYQQQQLESAAVLIASSVEECRNLRMLGFRQPIAVVPNGVETYSTAEYSSKSRLKNNRNILFLSRIHEKKGLINLVRAWHQLAIQGWTLRIAGPDESNHLSVVLKEALRLGVLDSIEYLGEVNGADKQKAYLDADIFVLPTFSENFGVVVAEALSYGIPVITTTGTPWADLESYRCGWYIDIGIAPLVDALRNATKLTDEERLIMGERGKEYVKRYDWNKFAAQTAQVYRWVLGMGEKPDCIH